LYCVRMKVDHKTVIKLTHNMSLVEQKLVLMCISQLRRENPSNSRHFTIRFDDFCREVGSEPSTKVFGILKAAAMRLQTRLLIINELIIDEDQQGWERGAISVLSEHLYNDGGDEIKLSFSVEFMPYLKEISSDSTHYLIQDCMGMTSAYSMGIYELICMKYNRENLRLGIPYVVEYVIGVEELRLMFGLFNKYKAYKDFRVRVLDVSVREINEYSPLHVEYEQIKRGRKIDQIVFKITAKECSHPTSQQEVCFSNNT